MRRPSGRWGRTTRTSAQGNGPPAGGPAAPFFDRFDKDGDGRVTGEEAPRPIRERFDDVDADGDGVLTAVEVMQFMRRR